MKRDRWRYPALAKPDSDGAYCYHVQRRISVWFSRRLAGHISPNAATDLDLIFGVAAAVLVLLDHWFLGVVLIQTFAFSVALMEKSHEFKVVRQGLATSWTP